MRAFIPALLVLFWVGPLGAQTVDRFVTEGILADEAAALQIQSDDEQRDIERWLDDLEAEQQQRDDIKRWLDDLGKPNSR